MQPESEPASTSTALVATATPKEPLYALGRADAPGPRGCWATKRDGTVCHSPRRGDGDYCNAHSGVGIGADPKGHSTVGVRRSAEVRRRRADLRLVIGSTRLDTPRSALRAAVVVEAERLAGRAVSAALDPAMPSAQTVKAVLDLVEAVDPAPKVTATLSTDLDPEGVSKMSLSQLLSFAEHHGITPPNGSVEPLSQLEG